MHQRHLARGRIPADAKAPSATKPVRFLAAIIAVIFN